MIICKNAPFYQEAGLFHIKSSVKINTNNKINIKKITNTKLSTWGALLLIIKINLITKIKANYVGHNSAFNRMFKSNQ